MRASRRAPSVLVAAATLAALAGCSGGGAAVEHGAPALLRVFWVAAGKQVLVWSREQDVALQTSAHPLAGEMELVFDRLLDGTRIEDTVVQNGVTMSRTKANPPVTMTWPMSDRVMSDPPFTMDVLYNSVGLYGPGTSYILLRPHIPGVPPATTVTLHLDHANIVSRGGEEMDGPPEIKVVTQAFTASVRSPQAAAGDGGVATVDTDFRLPIEFTNRLQAAAPLPFIHARVAGAELPVQLLLDTRVPSLAYLAPAACAGAWPPNATVDVTLDPGLPDAFGVGLAAPASGRFTTGAGPRLPAAGCPPAATDGGAADGAPGAAGDGAVDAATDGGVDAPAQGGDAPSADGGVADTSDAAPPAGDA